MYIAASHANGHDRTAVFDEERWCQRDERPLAWLDLIWIVGRQAQTSNAIAGAELLWANQVEGILQLSLATLT